MSKTTLVFCTGVVAVAVMYPSQLIPSVSEIYTEFSVTLFGCCGIFTMHNAHHTWGLTVWVSSEGLDTESGHHLEIKERGKNRTATNWDYNSQPLDLQSSAVTTRHITPRAQCSTQGAVHYNIKIMHHEGKDLPSAVSVRGVLLSHMLQTQRKDMSTLVHCSFHNYSTGINNSRVKIGGLKNCTQVYNCTP